MLRHRIGRIRRDSQNMNFPESILHIHIVKTCTAKSNHSHTEFAQAVDYLFINRVIYKYTYRIKALCKTYGILIELGLKIFYGYVFSL